MNSRVTLHQTPEGAICFMDQALTIGEKINSSGKEILSLCTGQNTIPQICELLAKKLGTELTPPKKSIELFLREASNMSLLFWESSPSNVPINLTGNTQKTVPYGVVFEIIRQCNLSCNYCYMNASPAIPSELDGSLIIRCLHDLARMGIPRIQITGGEPLLHPDFLLIFESALSLFPVITLSTNATLFKPSLIEKIKELLIRYKQRPLQGFLIQITLDGPEQIHNQIRHSTSAFSSTIEAIKALASADMNVKVTTTLNSKNWFCIEETIQIAKSAGAKLYSLGQITEMGRAAQKDSIPEATMTSVYQSFQQWKRQYESPTFKIQWIDEKEEKQIKSASKTSNCGLGTQFVSITGDGNVTPCLMLRKSIGNIREHSVDEILTNEKSRFFENLRTPSSDNCNLCEQKPHCQQCIATALEHSKHVANCWWRNEWSPLG